MNSYLLDKKSELSMIEVARAFWNYAGRDRQKCTGDLVSKVKLP